MEIDIKQEKISIGAKYNIFLDRKEKYSAEKKLFRFLDEINLFDLSSLRARYHIKQEWSWFKTAYKLHRYDNNTYYFKTASIWKPHYKCQVGEDMYEIFGHRGRKYSIYKKNKQIAWWDKNKVRWFNGDNYQIIADFDVDRELLISFCLILDNDRSQNRSESAVTVDYGNIGPQAKKFNPDWRPKRANHF